MPDGRGGTGYKCNGAAVLDQEHALWLMFGCLLGGGGGVSGYLGELTHTELQGIEILRRGSKYYHTSFPYCG